MALAARFQNLVPVLFDMTLGMMLADTPAVFLVRIASPKFPFKLMRMAEAVIFAAIGMAVIFGYSFGL